MTWLCSTPLVECTPDLNGQRNAVIHAVRSVPGYPLMFCVFVEGACYWNLTVDRLGSHGFQWWDCPSSECTVVVLEFLKGRQCVCRERDAKTDLKAEYLFTVDWIGSGTTAEQNGVWGHKCSHFLRLAAGGFALVPNNGVLFGDAVGESKWPKPGFPLNRNEMLSCEGGI